MNLLFMAETYRGKKEFQNSLQGEILYEGKRKKECKRYIKKIIPYLCNLSIIQL